MEETPWFVKRSKPRGAVPCKPISRASSEEEEEESTVVFRPRGKTTRNAPKNLSFDQDEPEEETFTIRRSQLSKQLREADSLSLEQASITPSYSSEYIAAFKAETPRRKYSVDFDHPSIPSEEVIAAAKEQRRAAQQPADYISLGTVSGPRGLRKESDLDEFTEEHLPLGAKAEKHYAETLKQEMKNAIEEVEVEKEWEQAQLKRTTPHLPKEEVYKSAEIPKTAKLPNVSDAKNRLSRRLVALQDSVSAHDKVMGDTKAALAELEVGERENKKEVVEAEEKQSWFKELEVFVDSLARFMDGKMGDLQDLERLAIDLPSPAEMEERLNALFDDVQAPEYLDPSAVTADGTLHPSSILTRFGEWRKRYPQEYENTWATLALSNIYEFYARKEMILWSPSKGLQGCKWFNELIEYAEDQEAVQTVVGNVVVNKMVGFAERGLWEDGWIKTVQEVEMVLGKGNARYQTMVAAFLDAGTNLAR